MARGFHAITSPWIGRTKLDKGSHNILLRAGVTLISCPVTEHCSTGMRQIFVSAVSILWGHGQNCARPDATWFTCVLSLDDYLTLPVSE